MEALAGLFVSSFAAATLIPLPSEAALFAYLKLEPANAPLAIAVATLGNTAGGMTTYLVGLLLPERTTSRLSPRALKHVRRFGAPLTFFAWLPLVGDGLCLAAGWLRLRWWAVLALAGAGRLARYIVIAYWAAA